jgi:hypothetical protein
MSIRHHLDLSTPGSQISWGVVTLGTGAFLARAVIRKEVFKN